MDHPDLFMTGHVVGYVLTLCMPACAGLLFAAMAVVSFVGVMPASFVADKLGRKWTIMPSCLGLAGALLLMAFTGSSEAANQCVRTRRLSDVAFLHVRGQKSAANGSHMSCLRRTPAACCLKCPALCQALLLSCLKPSIAVCSGYPSKIWQLR